jgi:chemotaxis protein MotB
MGKKKHPEHVNHERWLVSYADFITLLFAFFVVMFAVSHVDNKKVEQFSASFSDSMGIHALPPGGEGVLPSQALVVPPAASAGDRGDGVLPLELQRLKEALNALQKSEDMAKIQVIARRDELVIRLPDNVIYASGDDRLIDRSVEVLKAVAAPLKGTSVDIRVEGHTDNIPVGSGRWRSNWELSSARATAALLVLAHQGGIEPGRLSAAGFGEFRPIASNDTPEGRARNRRVDLVVTVSRPVAIEEPPPEGKEKDEAKEKDPRRDEPREARDDAKDEPKREAKGESKDEGERGESKGEKAEPKRAPKGDAKPERKEDGKEDER